MVARYVVAILIPNFKIYYDEAPTKSKYLGQKAQREIFITLECMFKVEKTKMDTFLIIVVVSNEFITFK